jgi:hypothetical protein
MLSNLKRIFIDRYFVKILSLESQLSAMERAFAVQERVLSQQMLSDTSRPFDKYCILLQQWRQQTLRSLVDKYTCERQLRTAIDEKKRQRAASTSEVQTLEANLVSSNERLAALSVQLCELKIELSAGEVNRSCLSETNLRYEEKLREQGQSLSSIRLITEEASRQLDTSPEYLRMASAVAAFAQMEARLSASMGRLELARSLFALREVELRNSTATLEAEKRLWLQRSYTNKEGDGDSSQQRYLSELRMRPEVESILRSIFRRVDAEGSGTASVEALLRCINTDSLHTMLEAAIGCFTLDKLISGLRREVSGTVTWGELLLQLFPEASEREPREALTAADLLALEKQELWGDINWGAVPLKLPLVSAGTANSYCCGTRSSVDGREEEARLMCERAFLLKRCQEMGRSLERRAEGIKAHFAGEIRIRAMREQQLQNQVDTHIVSCILIIDC